MIKSPNDIRGYHTATLDNGLRLVFVEDANCSKSACSLVVNTGSFDDPHDRPGFAHFVEHLLFNGNEKYPNVNQLSDFLAKHGGHCNAWTATEHSCFHFDSNHDAFDLALDYFAHQFINPLFSEAAIKSEQEAIHAEYKLKLRDDSRRIQQVHKETCNPSHPFHKFAVGNRQTLSNLPGRPVFDELLQFWQAHYQAQYTTVCVISNSSQYFEHVKTLFAKFPTQGISNVKPKIEVPLYRPSDLAKFICIRPVKELHKLNLTFALPDIDDLYASKMVSFISHIIGHEGTGSLFESLKNQGLINHLSAGNGISGSNFKDFNISIELTEIGESRIDLIITQVFSFLTFMNDNTPPEYLYDEQVKMSEVGFKYQEPTKPIKLANQIALNMHHYPEEDYLFGDFRMDGFDAAQWQFLFSFFKPENMRITLVSQNISPNKEAHWYHTPYSVQTIDQDVLNELNNLTPNTGTFAYPSPNPYLENPVQIEAVDFNASKPIQLDHALGWQCWYKQDIQFRVPKGNIYLGLDLPNAVSTCQKQAFMRLYCELFLDGMSDIHYQSEMAGLHYNIYAHASGITLYTSGLSTNQQNLLLTLTQSLTQISPTRSRFEEVKRQLIKHWRNSEANKPISQLFSKLNAHLIPSTATSIELASALEHTSIEEFKTFLKDMFTELAAEILIYGNWTTTQATAINQELKQALANSKKVEELPRTLNQIGDDGILELTKKVNHEDSAALIYLQGLDGFSTDKHVTTDYIEKAYFILASHILAPFTFNYLRVERQLGYMVGSGYMPLCNVPGLAMYVQSHDHNSKALTKELNNCLTEFIDFLSAMSAQDFAKHKEAVIHQYLETPNSLAQKSQQLWISVGNKDYGFDQKEKIAKELATIEHHQLISWYSALFTPNLNKGIIVNSRHV